MLEIKLAGIKDLDFIASLYVEQFNSNQNFDYEIEPITIEQGKHRWEKHLKTKPMLVAYNNDIFLGFCVLNDSFESLNIENMYVVSSVKSLEIYAEFIFAAGRYALGSGYSIMSIMIDGQNESMKNLCLGLGARSDCIYGMMYTYYERFVWDDLNWM